MGWVPFGASKKFDADKFEKELIGLSGKITSSEKRLIRLKRNKANFKNGILLYCLPLYVSFLAYLFVRRHTIQGVQVYEWGVVVLLPIVLLYIRRFYGLWYDRSIRSLQASLERLRSDHGDKIQQLKDQSRFDRTAELLKRFGTGEDIAEMEREKDAILKTREEYFKLLEQGESQQTALAKIQKGTGSSVYDAFVNIMMGPDETAPDMRYALICASCHKHNGLAPPGVLAAEVTYECPGCGAMNPPDTPSSND